MNLFNLERVFQQKKERKWHTIYVAVDAHGTLIKAYHDHIEFYTGAVEVMQWFNSREDFKVILWTSTHHKEINNLRNKAWENCFHFDFVNENPLEKDSDRACFTTGKFYFNILLDDKAGFEPETDWLLIKKELQRIGEWK
jgi:hypothetical protein